MTQPTDGDLLTINQLAAKLHMHPGTVRGLWRKKAIPGIKIGHRTLRFEYPAVLDALRTAGAADDVAPTEMERHLPVAAHLRADGAANQA